MLHLNGLQVRGVHKKAAGLVGPILKESIGAAEQRRMARKARSFSLGRDLRSQRLWQLDDGIVLN